MIKLLYWQAFNIFNHLDMIVKPDQNWNEFQHSDEVVELIATSLILEENKGIWQYFNFEESQQSECASIWCSNELSATNQVNLTFDSNESNASIKSLRLELTNNASDYFKQLLKLKRELKKRFGIREI